MFQTSGKVALGARTVGVVSRDDAVVEDGLVLFSSGNWSYLIDTDGRVVHEWRSSWKVFAAYLLDDGCLLRDGSDKIDAPLFNVGGAAGYVECVTWDNEPVWRFWFSCKHRYLSHHHLEPVPVSGGCVKDCRTGALGHVLVLVWERKSREEALAVGRRPDLIPDNELWDNVVVCIAPDGKGGATEVWRWAMWDHLVQDFDPSKPNFCADVSQRPDRFDINACPPGGRMGQRDRPRLTAGASSSDKINKTTGEKDWLHVNSISYCPERNHILLSLNTHSELIIINRGEGVENEDKPPAEGILWRWGNPQHYSRGTREDQRLFQQHSAAFIPRGRRGAGSVLCFNNGRQPDRAYSTVDQLRLPDLPAEPAPAGPDAPTFSGEYGPAPAAAAWGPPGPSWTFGETPGRQGSFYCSYVSSCQRLQDNTLVVLGPQGVIIEVTPDGQECWRYINPVIDSFDGAVAFAAQGAFPPPEARRLLFHAKKYSMRFPAFAGRVLQSAQRYLEA